MTSLVVAFVVGVLSSGAATALVTLRKRLRFRLSFRRVLNLIVSLSSRIAADGFSPDYVVGIDRNGGIVASILASHFGLLPAISVATTNRREADGTRSTHIPEPFASNLHRLGGKKLLVVICCNDSGVSLGAVVEHLHAAKRAPAEIRTCALYSSVSPRVTPRYVGAVVGQDTKMPMNRILRSLPWVTPDWRLVFAEERHGAGN